MQKKQEQAKNSAQSGQAQPPNVTRRLRGGVLVADSAAIDETAERTFSDYGVGVNERSLQAWEELLAHRASDQADARAVRRENRWRTIAGAAFVVLSALGIANLNSIEEELKGTIDAAVLAAMVTQSESLSSDLDSRFGTLERDFGVEIVPQQVALAFERQVASINEKIGLERTIFELWNLAADLGQPGTKSFTNTERDKALESLQRLRGAGVTGSEVIVPVERIVDAFTSAGLIEEIDDIEPFIRNAAKVSAGLTFNLMMHYGRIVVGSSSFTPSQEEAFNRYKSLCVRNKLPEVALVFGAMRAFADNSFARNAETTSLLQDAKYLSREDRNSLIGLMASLNQASPGAEDGGLVVAFQIRLASIAKSLMQEYQSELKEIEE